MGRLRRALGWLGRRRTQTQLTRAHEMARAAGGRHDPLAVEGLGDWLEVCRRGRLAAFVTLPSEAVAALWHEVADDPDYSRVCRRTLGAVLKPARLDSIDKRLRPDGVLRAWAIACRMEGIDPRRPSRLPRLFTIDARLDPAGGARWEATGGDPPVRRASGPAPVTISAWPASEHAEALLRLRWRRHGVPP